MNIEEVMRMTNIEFASIFKDSLKLGILVADGTRRSAVMNSCAKIDSEDFYYSTVHAPMKTMENAFRIMFSHGVETLVCPIFSKAVLASRGINYQKYSIVPIFHNLFVSAKWLKFYSDNDISVSVYGDIETFKGTICENFIDNIIQTEKETKGRKKKVLLGVGETPYLGAGIPEQVIKIYKKSGRIPTREDMVNDYFGYNLPFANFYFMTSKMSSFGAIPRYLVDGNTEFYFFPSLVAEGITEKTFRKVVYDFVCLRVKNREFHYMIPNSEDKTELKKYFRESVGKVIGLGKCKNNMWVFDI